MYESKEERNETKALVYDLMTGVLNDPGSFPIYKLLSIADAYAPGQPCEELYARIYGAKVRLNERLGVQEDPDVEIMIGNFLDIARNLSLQMFDYGYRHAELFLKRTD